MVRFPLLLAATAILMAPAMAFAQQPGAQQPGAMPMVPASGPILSLSVSESVESAPDMATINTGVQTNAPAARDAMAKNAAQMERLIAALLKGGVARKDIQTSGINLSPRYDYSNLKEGEGPRFLGYEASNQLTVHVRALDKAGALVDAMVTAGATNINGPSFGIAEPDKLLDQARAKALTTAQARANLYAQATGYRSARLITIAEGGGFQPPMPVFTARAMAAEAAPQTKIEPGQISSSISLNVQYMLER